MGGGAGVSDSAGGSGTDASAGPTFSCTGIISPVVYADYFSTPEAVLLGERVLGRSQGAPHPPEIAPAAWWRSWRAPPRERHGSKKSPHGASEGFSR
jgi:hypothetical protein